MLPGDDADDGEDGYSRVTDVITDSDEDDPNTGVLVNVVAAGGDRAPEDKVTLVTALPVDLSVSFA